MLCVNLIANTHAATIYVTVSGTNDPETAVTWQFAATSNEENNLPTLSGETLGDWANNNSVKSLPESVFVSVATFIEQWKESCPYFVMGEESAADAKKVVDEPV